MLKLRRFCLICGIPTSSKGNSHFKNFFIRNDETQKWIDISDEKDIYTEWRLTIPNNMNLLGLKEIITEEDGYSFEGEIWVIGELK